MVFLFRFCVSLIFSLLLFFVFFFSILLLSTFGYQNNIKNSCCCLLSSLSLCFFRSKCRRVPNNPTKEEEEEEMIFNLEGLTVYFPYEYLYPVRVSTHAQTQTRAAFFISLRRSLALSLCLLALTRNFPSRHGTNNFLRRNNTNT